MVFWQTALMDQPVARPDFDIGEAIGVGWRRLWPNVGPMLLFAVVMWAAQFLLNALQPEGAAGALVFGLLGIVVSSLVTLGWIRLALDITDGRPVTKDAVVASFGLLVPYVVATIVYTVAVVVGLVLLIVPGIIVAIMWVFYGFHVVDTGERSGMAALRRSTEITRGHRGKLFAFGLVLLLLNILGLIVLIVGVLVTSAISLLAVAHVYRQLAGAPMAAAPDDLGWSTS